MWSFRKDLWVYLFVCAFYFYITWIYTSLPFINGGFDAPYYTESAESFLSGKGFQTVDFYCALPAEEAVRPLDVFPLGFPFLVSLGIRSGLAPYNAGVLISILSAFFSLLIITWLFLRYFPRGLALLSSVFLVCELEPYSAMCGSEAPALLFCMISFLLIYLALEAKNAWGFLFLSGCLGGLAYTIRNMALSLPCSVLVFFALWALAERNRKNLWKGACWLSGWCLAACWMPIRNLIVFGQINPYNMSPSTRPFWTNLCEYIQTFFYVTKISNMYPRKAALIGCGVIVLCVVTALYLLYLYMNHRQAMVERLKGFKISREKAAFCFLLLLYLGATAGIAILARSVYQQGHRMDERMVYPVAWIKLGIFAFLFCFLYSLVSIKGERKVFSFCKKSFVVCGTFLFFFVLNLNTLQGVKASAVNAIPKNEYIQVHDFIPTDQFVFCFQYWYYWEWANIDGRSIYIDSEKIRKGMESGSCWGFVLADEDLEIMDEKHFQIYDDLISKILKSPGDFPEYEIIQMTPHIKGFHYKVPDNSAPKRNDR